MGVRLLATKDINPSVWAFDKDNPFLRVGEMATVIDCLTGTLTDELVPFHLYTLQKDGIDGEEGEKRCMHGRIFLDSCIHGKALEGMAGKAIHCRSDFEGQCLRDLFKKEGVISSEKYGVVTIFHPSKDEQIVSRILSYSGMLDYRVDLIR